MNNKFSTKLLFIVLLFLINIVILHYINNKNIVTAVYTGCNSDHYEGERNRYKVTCGGEGTCTNVVCTISSTRSWYNTCEYTCNESGNWDCEEIADLQCKDGACDADCVGIPTNTPKPSRRPTRTPTPRTPTRTPTPTITPTPTLILPPSETPSPTITPTPTIDPNSCQCSRITYSGGLFDVDQTVDFTAYAKVYISPYPNIRVNTITFYVDSWDGTNLLRITTPTPIPVNGPATVLQPTPTSAYNEYWATWSYTIPTRIPTPGTTSEEVEYTVSFDSQCGLIATNFNNANTAVLSQTAVRKITFWEKIAGFFKTLLSVLKNGSPLAHLLPEKTNKNVLSSQTNILGITPGPTQAMTLKLLSLNPGELMESGCNYLKFKLKYQY